MGKIIQFQNGQTFSRLKVNERPVDENDWLEAATVTVQFFDSALNSLLGIEARESNVPGWRVPIGYLILDIEEAEELGRALQTAAMDAKGDS